MALVGVRATSFAAHAGLKPQASTRAQNPAATPVADTDSATFSEQSLREASQVSTEGSSMTRSEVRATLEDGTEILFNNKTGAIFVDGNKLQLKNFANALKDDLAIQNEDGQILVHNLGTGETLTLNANGGQIKDAEGNLSVASGPGNATGVSGTALYINNTGRAASTGNEADVIINRQAGASINAGDGDDSIFNFAASASALNAGAGNDAIWTKNSEGLSIDTGAGDSYVKLLGNMRRGSIKLGAGVNIVDAKGKVLTSVDISSEEGNGEGATSIVAKSINGNASDRSSLTLRGAGNNIELTKALAHTDLNTGTGSSTVKAATLLSSMVEMGGAGSDGEQVLMIKGRVDGLTYKGGEGNDAVVLGGKVSDSNIQLGAGDNQFGAQKQARGKYVGTEVSNTSISATGDGTNIFVMGKFKTGGNAGISLGNGDNYLEMAGVAGQSPLSIDASQAKGYQEVHIGGSVKDLNYKGGSGIDDVNIYGKAVDSSFDMGDGLAMLYVTGAAKGLDFNASGTAAATFLGAGAIMSSKNRRSSIVLGNDVGTITTLGKVQADIDMSAATQATSMNVGSVLVDSTVKIGTADRYSRNIRIATGTSSKQSRISNTTITEEEGGGILTIVTKDMDNTKVDLLESDSNDAADSTLLNMVVLGSLSNSHIKEDGFGSVIYAKHIKNGSSLELGSGGANLNFHKIGGLKGDRVRINVEGSLPYNNTYGETTYPQTNFGVEGSIVRADINLGVGIDNMTVGGQVRDSNIDLGGGTNSITLNKGAVGSNFTGTGVNEMIVKGFGSAGNQRNSVSFSGEMASLNVWGSAWATDVKLESKLNFFRSMGVVNGKGRNSMTLAVGTDDAKVTNLVNFEGGLRNAHITAKGGEGSSTQITNATGAIKNSTINITSENNDVNLGVLHNTNINVQGEGTNWVLFRKKVTGKNNIEVKGHAHINAMVTADFGSKKSDSTHIQMENGDFKFQTGKVNNFHVDASGSVAGTFVSLNNSSIKGKGTLDISEVFKRSSLELTGDSKIHIKDLDLGSSLSGVGTNEIYAASMDGSIDASAMTGGTISLGISTGNIKAGAGMSIGIGQMIRGTLDDNKGADMTIGVIAAGATVNITGQDASRIAFNALSGRINLESASYSAAKSSQIQFGGNGFGAYQVKIGGEYVSTAGVSLTDPIDINSFGHKPDDFLTRQRKNDDTGDEDGMPPLIAG